MSNIIDIGTKINLQNLLISRLLIQANSGGGKSALARKIIEETYGKVPFIVLDYDGEYYTLKEKFDDILVIGGQYGDVPLSMKSVKLLPKEIIGNQLSVVIDISDLKDSEKIMYVKQFLETMMELNKDYWKPYLVFLEEAHKLCGEQDKQESARSVKDLMSRGRKKGYCGILLTQRISKLHKDAAAECNNKFIGRTNLDIDMDRAAKELGFSNQSEFSRLSLRDLQPGHFYAYGTSIEPNHVHEVTIILPSSKMVKAGHTIDIKPKKPTQRILTMLAKLNDLPNDAAKELKTIAELQVEVSRLNKLLKVPAKPIATTTSSSSQKDITLIQSLRSEVALLKEQLKIKDKEVLPWKKLAVDRGIILGKINQISKPDGIEIKESDIKNINTVLKVASTVTRTPVTVSSGNGQLGKCSREVIRFLAQYPARQFTKVQVGIATGYSPGSGGFNNSLSELNQKGFILRDGKLQVNPDAIDEIVTIVGAIQHQDYDIETFKSRLGKCEREIYEVLLKSPNDTFTKEELSQATETPYSAGSGGFNNSLSRLNTLELIQRTNGQIRLNPELLELMN